jgi:hypothetical protein
MQSAHPHPQPRLRNAAPEKLEPLGQVSAPSLSDLFVALMQRQTAIPGDA